MSESREAQKKGMLEALGPGGMGRARLVRLRFLKRELLGRAKKLHWRSPEATRR